MRQTPAHRGVEGQTRPVRGRARGMLHVVKTKGSAVPAGRGRTVPLLHWELPQTTALQPAVEGCAHERWWTTHLIRGREGDIPDEQQHPRIPHQARPVVGTDHCKQRRVGSAPRVMVPAAALLAGATAAAAAAHCPGSAAAAAISPAAGWFGAGIDGNNRLVVLLFRAHGGVCCYAFSGCTTFAFAGAWCTVVAAGAWPAAGTGCCCWCCVRCCWHCCYCSFSSYTARVSRIHHRVHAARRTDCPACASPCAARAPWNGAVLAWLPRLRLAALLQRFTGMLWRSWCFFSLYRLSWVAKSRIGIVRGTVRAEHLAKVLWCLSDHRSCTLRWISRLVSV